LPTQVFALQLGTSSYLKSARSWKSNIRPVQPFCYDCRFLQEPGLSNIGLWQWYLITWNGRLVHWYYRLWFDPIKACARVVHVYTRSGLLDLNKGRASFRWLGDLVIKCWIQGSVNTMSFWYYTNRLSESKQPIISRIIGASKEENVLVLCLIHKNSWLEININPEWWLSINLDLHIQHENRQSISHDDESSSTWPNGLSWLKRYLQDGTWTFRMGRKMDENDSLFYRSGSPRNSFTAKNENRANSKNIQIKEKGKLICQGNTAWETESPSGAIVSGFRIPHRVLIMLNVGEILANWKNKIPDWDLYSKKADIPLLSPWSSGRRTSSLRLSWLASGMRSPIVVAFLAITLQQDN